MSHPKRIFLNPPHQTGQEQHWLNKVLESNYLAPVGPMLDEFEKTLGSETERLDLAEEEIQNEGRAKRGDKTILPIALNSGSCGIHLALRLIGVRAW